MLRIDREMIKRDAVPRNNRSASRGTSRCFPDSPLPAPRPNIRFPRFSMRPFAISLATAALALIGTPLVWATTASTHSSVEVHSTGGTSQSVIQYTNTSDDNAQSSTHCFMSDGNRTSTDCNDLFITHP